MKKKDGKSRLRVDFRQRNKVTMENRCPSPKTDADMDQLRDGGVFGDPLEVGLSYKNEGRGHSEDCFTTRTSTWGDW